MPPSPIIATSGYMLVIFFSDTNYVLTGFSAEYKISKCPNNCSNHGLCNPKTNQCQCDQGWSGLSCLTEICPDNCGESSQKGFCRGKYFAERRRFCVGHFSGGPGQNSYKI